MADKSPNFSVVAARASPYSGTFLVREATSWFLASKKAVSPVFAYSSPRRSLTFCQKLRFPPTYCVGISSAPGNSFRPRSVCKIFASVPGWPGIVSGTLRMRPLSVVGSPANSATSSIMRLIFGLLTQGPISAGVILLAAGTARAISKTRSASSLAASFRVF